MTNHDAFEQPLSNDPEENLRIENELLKLKLKAELGAEPFSVSDISPEIENEFLKNVLAFEHNFANSKPAKVYDLLGKPIFKRSDDLDDDELEQALTALVDVMAKKNIEVYFGDDNEYDSRTQYHFITEELFDHESTFVPMPGMTTYFDYEEFHPNHKKEIERRAIKFLSAWFEKDIEACGYELTHHAILPDRTQMSKADVLARIAHIFDFSTGFTEEKYEIFDIGFNLEAGMGHAEGGLKYEVLLKTGEKVPVGGAFKLYFSLERDYWEIVYMVLPGFKY
jgi:hypothetical protein